MSESYTVTIDIEANSQADADKACQDLYYGNKVSSDVDIVGASVVKDSEDPQARRIAELEEELAEALADYRAVTTPFGR